MSIPSSRVERRRRRLSSPLAFIVTALVVLVVAPAAYADHKPNHVPKPSGDTTPPQTTITSDPADPTSSTSATFRFTSSERHSTFTCSLDSSSFEECVSPRQYSGLSTGGHVFRVRATDRAGNTDPTPAEYSWTIQAPPPGPGIQVSCGQVLTKSTVVGNDLSECEEGLVVGSNNITIDLNGHVIDGKGLGVGIRNDGFDGVTVKNGTVKDFDYGVQLNAGTERNVVETLGLDANEIAGAYVDGAGGSNELRNNSATLNGRGIALVNGATGNVVSRNTVSDNAKEGLFIQGSSGNRLESNGVTGSSDADVVLEGATANTVIGNTVFAGGDGGVNLVAGSNDNRIEANTSSENGDAGFNVFESHGNDLISNVAHRNSDSGIVLELATGNLIRGNDVRLNPGGLELHQSSGNRLESNDASDSLGRGIELGGFSFANQLVQNIAGGNASGGIYVGDEAPAGEGNLLDGNTTSANSGNGIHVAKGGHTITRNIANGNSSWGIYAAVGNDDGGGNRASGNGEPEQCFGVRCRP